MKLIKVDSLTDGKNIIEGLEGTYGSQGKKNYYITCVKGVVTINACGECTVDEVLPEAALPWHLIICKGDRITPHYVDDNHLLLHLKGGETAFGCYKAKG